MKDLRRDLWANLSLWTFNVGVKEARVNSWLTWETDCSSQENLFSLFSDVSFSEQESSRVEFCDSVFIAGGKKYSLPFDFFFFWCFTWWIIRVQMNSKNSLTEALTAEQDYVETWPHGWINLMQLASLKTYYEPGTWSVLHEAQRGKTQSFP